MSFSIGIIGLPNVGKSTLFKALTKKPVNISNYPFCTIAPNFGIVEVPDERLNVLAKISKSEKIIPTVIQFVDIAGLVKGAHQGQGLGNQFLSHIREVDAVCQVVRAFNNPNIIHVESRLAPKDDIQIINLELIMADLATVTNRINVLETKAKTGDKSSQKLLEVCTKIKNVLDKGELPSPTLLIAVEKNLTKDLNLLTLKPMLCIINIGEESINKKNLQSEIYNLKSIPISAKLESELAELPDNEQQEYLHELGLKKTGLDKLIAASYQLLNLITFFTTGPKETRAWTLVKGATAQKAGGKIHTDFCEKFIRAEIISCQNLITAGSETKAREKGLLKTEGKNYIVQDGDVIHFKI